MVFRKTLFFESEYTAVFRTQSKCFHHWALWIILSLVAAEFIGIRSCKQEKAFVP